MLLVKLFQAGSIFLDIVSVAIVVYAVMTWFRPSNAIFRWLEGFVSPFIQPFRGLSMWLMRKTGMPLDFSCWFALIGINIVNRLWLGLGRLLY